jgi:hypothetical protein
VLVCERALEFIEHRIQMPAGPDFRAIQSDHYRMFGVTGTHLTHPEFAEAIFLRRRASFLDHKIVARR